MSKDIENRDDIKVLVDEFYKKVLKDDVIGYFFHEIVQLDWNKHMPRMYDFWETTLFHTGPYRGNPLQVHIDIHNKSPLESKHFQQWLVLFDETVDELYSGEKADLAKTRALSMATVMQIKIKSHDP